MVMILNLESYAHNQARSFGLGNQTTTTGSVSTLPLIFSKVVYASKFKVIRK